jgi:4-hydroxy-tetrahydrodipicolinate reductase
MKVAIIGYGKMGRQIERTLTERGHEVALIVDVDNAGDLSTEGMRGVDVAIEFTAPDAALGNIVKCLEIGVPVVCGTTAWTAHLPEVEALCRERDGAFFYASNYSIGVNVMFALNRQLARIMNRFPEYDVTVEETHHTQKKDAPSGTAITIAADIVASLDRKTEWVGQVTTAPAELEVTSVRRSTVAGIHTVTYESPVDTLTLSHTIKERSGLALGAVLAAEFLVGKKGLFTMNDLLGF